MIKIKLEYSDATLLYSQKVLRSHCENTQRCKGCIFSDNYGQICTVGVPELWQRQEAGTDPAGKETK